jgi:hypothetical protein
MFFIDLNAILFDYNDLALWNSNYAWDFTTISVNVATNEIQLSGGTVGGLTVPAFVFFGDTNITDFYDSGGYFTTIEANAFQGCVSLIGTDGFSNCTLIQEYAFEGCTSYSASFGVGSFENVVTIELYAFANILSIALPATFNSLTTIGQNAFNFAVIPDGDFLFPVLTDLGGTVGDDRVFDGWIGAAAMNLTIPAALMTIDAGAPDGDIQYLQANNTVNITTV